MLGMQSCLYCIHYYLYTTSEVTHQINIGRSNYLPRMPQWVLTTMTTIHGIFFISVSVNYLKLRVVVKSQWSHCRINTSEDSLSFELCSPPDANSSVLHEHMSPLCFLSFQTFAYRKRAVGGREVWMSQQGWGSLFSKTKRCIWMSNTGG